MLQSVPAYDIQDIMKEIWIIRVSERVRGLTGTRSSMMFFPSLSHTHTYRHSNIHIHTDSKDEDIPCFPRGGQRRCVCVRSGGRLLYYKLHHQHHSLQQTRRQKKNCTGLPRPPATELTPLWSHLLCLPPLASPTQHTHTSFHYPYSCQLPPPKAY